MLLFIAALCLRSEGFCECCGLDCGVSIAVGGGSIVLNAVAVSADASGNVAANVVAINAVVLLLQILCC